ncbi:MAG TPA: hypothetical protein DCY85_01200 [Firmicutes bacterium]|nr:hypothetical protein [Bacillota bacterium]
MSRVLYSNKEQRPMEGYNFKIWMEKGDRCCNTFVAEDSPSGRKSHFNQHRNAGEQHSYYYSDS